MTKLRRTAKTSLDTGAGFGPGIQVPPRTKVVLVAVVLVAGYVFATKVLFSLSEDSKRVSHDVQRPTPTVAGETRTLPRSASPRRHTRPQAPSIRGLVSSVSGERLMGAEVCLSQSRSGVASALSCKTTDRSGAFELAAIARDGDLLVATAAAHETQLRKLQPSSDLGAVDFVLSPARAVNVRGVVVDAAGGAVPRALVFARRAGLADAAGSAWSDERGAFGLTLDPGPVTLTAQAEAYAPSQVEIAAPTDGVALVLAAASTLVGVVVEDATDRPLPEVVVSAYAQSPLHPTGLQALTDAEGAFRLTGLHSGDYALRTSAAEWGGGEATATVGIAEVSRPVVLRVRRATTFVGVVRAGGESCAGGAVLLRTESTLVGGEADASGAVSIFGLLPGRYEATIRCPHAVTRVEPVEIGTQPVRREWDLETGATVRGRVERANGQPVERASVQMVPKSGAEGENERPRSSVSCKAGERGEFVCRGVEPGHYEFSLGSEPPLTAGSIEIAPADMDLGPIVLGMPAAASILVTIADSRMGQPSTFQVLAHKTGSPPAGAQATAEGHLFQDLPLGAYAVYFGPTSQVPETAPRVSLTTDGELARVTLAPPPTLEIAGVVVDASGAPVPEVWLHAESADSPVARAPGVPALTNERGEFSLRGLIPGVYDVLSSGREPLRLVESVNAGARDLIVRLRD